MRTHASPVCSALVATLALPATATVVIDWVTVGDRNNPADSVVMGDGTTGYGSVVHVYNIGKYEVTIGQYTEFLNHAAAVPAGSYQTNLWNRSMASDGYVAGISRGGSGTVADPYFYQAIGSRNRPVTYVSWFDAARFTNWMSNGQGGGSTETGTYNLGGAESGIFTVQPGATIRIPSEDEWYKAAYYQPAAQGGDTDNYWLYPTASNTLDGNMIGVANSANYYDGNYAKDQNGLPSYLTDAGAYGANSASYYGTSDQGGNVWEWNDAVIGSSRGLRGGLWFLGEDSLRSSARVSGPPEVEGGNVGFRLAGIPEPSVSLLVLFGGGLGLARRRRSCI